MDNNKLHAFFWLGDIDNYFLGHQFEEIFKARIYRDYLENKPDAVVLDIGANVGIFSLYASKYAKQVYSLEPAKEHFDCLVRMLDFNSITNVKAINKALYTENTTLPFFHNPNKTMYSLHQAVADQSLNPETVETISLDKLFEDEKIEHVDLLKLDIEGTELEIINSEAFRVLADKIDTVVMELHSWNGRHPNQAKETLKQAGFKVATIPNDANILVGTK